ncbi:helix-turn-helix transcriptional regulator [Cupriavidus sp. AcVe19-6a]|uniref:helix-turn-helix domain-containing protein n=1 Tax=Cupriavidus sp. AcVe19-6a TaxID=2821358 RepID=UPI001AE791DF|nr:helix-turn-helix domain-containing protein [Cupriavidus sp. AcVe19-6a]
MYGFDQSDWYFRTDHQGNRIRADIPYRDLAAMLEIVAAARRANTARLESTIPKRASIRSSLASVPTDENSESRAEKSHLRAENSDSRVGNSDIRDPGVEQLKHSLRRPSSATEAREALEAIFAGVPIPIEAMPETPTAPKLERRESKPSVRYSPQSFLQAPPSNVQVRIDAGVHFLQAWREYRQLTHQQVAEQLGCTKSNVSKHESGESANMRARTRELFAVLYDCTIEQLTPIPIGAPKASNSSRPEPPEPGGQAPAATQYAPEGTQYPQRILAALDSGHTIITAWRVYRDLSIKQAAYAYGCTPSGFAQLEQRTNLKRKTLEKLAHVFRCKPEQLRLPVAEVGHRRNAP